MICKIAKGCATFQNSKKILYTRRKLVAMSENEIVATLSAVDLCNCKENDWIRKFQFMLSVFL